MIISTKIKKLSFQCLLSASLVSLLACSAGSENSEPSDTISRAQNATEDSKSNSTNSKGWVINPNGDLNRFFECLEAENTSLISAHRGGSYKDYPENSLETAQYISSRLPAIHEIDVATTRDGVLFLMHDDTLDRTTNGEGLAKDQNWKDVRILRLKDEKGKLTNFNPPSLERFLKWSKDKSLVQIDFKRSTRFDDVINLVEKLGAQKNVIYIAYSMAQARKLHRLAPDAMISVSIDSMSELNSAIGSGIPADRLLGFTGTQDPKPRLFSVLNNRDVEVIFGTLGGRNSLDNEIASSGDNSLYTELSVNGVDIIATDRPIEAHAALKRSGRAVKSGICNITG